MTQSTQTASAQIYELEHLDASVAEVFQMMLGGECLPSDGPAPEEDEKLTAMVGLAGALGGVCILRTGKAVALRLAEALAGMPFSDLDETVKDALGEITNMLVGAWKGRLAEYASTCMLSVPAIVTGKDYRVHLQNPQCRLIRSYQFGDCMFSLEILIESIG
jgi:chemotaxis protein CheX